MEKNQLGKTRMQMNGLNPLNTVLHTNCNRCWRSLCNMNSRLCWASISTLCFLSPSTSLLHFLEFLKFKGRTFLFDMSKQVIQAT